MGYVAYMDRREVCSWCLSKILEYRDHPEDGCKWEDNIKMSEKEVWVVRSEHAFEYRYVLFYNILVNDRPAYTMVVW